MQTSTATRNPPTVKELKEAKVLSRKHRKEYLSVINLPTRQDHWVKTFRVSELFKFEEEYALLQQDWSQPLRIAKVHGPYRDQSYLKLV